MDLQENENPNLSRILSSLSEEALTDDISLKADETVLTDDRSIAYSMNLYFSSVFTTEDHANFPTLDCIVDEKLENINFNNNEVRRHLFKLNPNKSPGPRAEPHRVMYFNPLTPSIKLQFLLLCFHVFLTEVVGRSC